MRIEHHLEQLVESTIAEATGHLSPSLLKQTTDPRHGDYQVNAAMPLSKKLRQNPREMATVIAAALSPLAAFEKAEVAGPGFINLTLSTSFIEGALQQALDDLEGEGVPQVSRPQKIVVDFSSPNIAKQMHVGHLRSTIIGDAICRLLRFVGHEVISDNHIGDWGTQYGLLLVGMNEFGNPAAQKQNPIEELERVYKLASARAKEDEDFAERARKELSKLQSGDEENLALWRKLVTTTRAELDVLYDRMGVVFDQWLGESAFNALLPGVVEQLIEKGLAREDQGAIGIFWKELPNAPKVLQKQEQPFLVRKRDGAFLYSTTDIAAVLFRKSEWQAERALYVVDARQALHFNQLFAVASLLGVDMTLEHVSFGTVLGTDGKPIKTRDGQAITLASLLDEAEKRAEVRLREGVEQGKVRLLDQEITRVARAVGIGAVKYADLRQNRTSDYQFDWDKMVSFQGNAGPYLQYVYARISSIFDKGGLGMNQAQSKISLLTPEEQKLGKVLVRFPDVVHRAAESAYPHFLTDHLYELAQAFSTFFEACPVLKADGRVRDSRLSLSALTARQMKRGLGLLGIDVVERM